MSESKVGYDYFGQGPVLLVVEIVNKISLDFFYLFQAIRDFEDDDKRQVYYPWLIKKYVEKYDQNCKYIDGESNFGVNFPYLLDSLYLFSRNILFRA